MKKIALIFAAAAITVTAAIGIAGCSVKSAESSRASSTGIVQAQQEDDQNNVQEYAQDNSQDNGGDDAEYNTVAPYQNSEWEKYESGDSQENTVAQSDDGAAQQSAEAQDDVECNTVAPFEG